MHDILNGIINDWSRKVMAGKAFLLKSVRVHLAYGSDGRSFFVEYS